MKTKSRPLSKVVDDKGKPIDLTKVKEDGILSIVMELEFEVIALSSLIRTLEKDLTKYKKDLDITLEDLEVAKGYLESLDEEGRQ